MKQSKSSKRWLNEHFKDKYVKRAHQEGLRARSAYKLTEINDKYHLIKSEMTVIDIGAAPGSWSEVIASIVGKNGKIIAIDLLPINPIVNVDIIQGDFIKKDIQELIYQKLNGKKVDLVLSDMAPNTSGISSLDHDLSINLVKTACDFAIKVLKCGGDLLIKVFQGKEMQEMIKSLQNNFREIKIIKPQASRMRSREIFVLARGFAPQNLK